MSGTEPRVLVVGAGAAGLSAAFTAAWRGARVQLLDLLGPGGQLQNAGVIETVPGLAPTTGPELVDQMVRRFDGLDVDTVFGEATSLSRGTEGFAVTTDEGQTLQADLVIVATGSTPRSLGVPGEAEFEHRGVSHCAACDGPLYRGKDVVVAGGGDGGADAALALHAAGATVTLAHRGTALYAAAALRRRIESIDEITVLPATEVIAIVGDRTVTGVALRATDGSEWTQPTSAVFTAVGISIDAGDLAASLGRDAHGRLLVDANLACTTPGVFAAGSVRHGASDQLVGVMGDGANAAVSALRWWSGELELAPPAPSPSANGTTPGSFATYADFYDRMTEAGFGDGLPLVPPTASRVDRFLAEAGLDGDEQIDPSGLTAREVAACGVAAGCEPAHGAIVVAAARSLLHDLDARRELLADSVLAVVVNGPARLTIDLNCSDGLFGPGWRANAAIGRAVRLLATGPLGIPASSGFGDPGQYTFCFGEDEEKSVWTPLHVQRGFAPGADTVTVFPAPVYRQVMDRAHNDSAGIVDYLTLFLRGRAAGTRLFGTQALSMLLVVGQELRRLLSPDYSKATLRDVLYERVTADDGTPFGPIAIASPDDIL
ncbi:MAG TPA: FAD-dependent oxidoreductase, partial [Pseudonocardia sp.]|nr:FAD-dependent oxidoreductase [Pseudonocardia sp.]